MKTLSLAITLSIIISLPSSFVFADISDDISGLDANKNGIRDDIDEFIRKQPYTPEQVKAVQQYCRSTQLAVTFNSEDRKRAKEISNLGNNAINCLYSRFKSSPRPGAVVAQYEELTANTSIRKKSYKKFNKAMDGTTSSIPENDTCEK